jgi:hypothetical protein
MSLHTQEIWRAVDLPFWAPYYEVSDLGNIRNKRNGKLLRPSKGKFGYVSVTLKKKPVKYCVAVHTLVLRAFRGPPLSSKHECCHADGVKHNNILANLRWGTRKENHSDKIRHGTTGRKFTKQEVASIKWLLKSGEKHYRIARKFGVASWTITNIATGKTYFD